MKTISKNVVLLCPICGNNQFEALDGEFRSPEETPDTARYRCSDCRTVFTKIELIEENSEKISFAVDDIGTEITKELEKELNKMLKF